MFPSALSAMWFCGSVVLGSSQPPAHVAENIRRENVEMKQET